MTEKVERDDKITRAVEVAKERAFSRRDFLHKSMLGTAAIGAATFALPILSQRAAGAPLPPDSIDKVYHAGTYGSIQAAIDAAEADAGGLVYVPPGNYVVSGLTLLQNNIWLLGAGAATKIQLQSAPTAPALKIDGAFSNILISDLLFDSQTVGAGTGVDIRNGTKAMIQRCYFQNLNAGVVFATNSDKPVRVLDSFFFGNNIHIISNLTRHLITGNVLENSVNEGLDISSSSQGWVSNNVFLNNNTGATFNPATEANEQNIISNNYFYGNKGGIDLQLAANVVVDGNVIEHTVESAGIFVSGNYAVISNNVIYDTIGLGLPGLWVSAADRTILTGNAVSLSSAEGILLDGGANEGVIQGNLVFNNSKAASGGPYSGIQIWASNNVNVIGNKVFDSDNPQKQQYGIKLASATSNIYIQNNDLRNNLTGPLSLVGTGHIIKRNIGYLTENGKSETISPDGVDQSLFKIPHGLAATPTYALVVPGDSLASSVAAWINALDGTHVHWKYNSAPGGPVALKWYAEV